MGQNLRRRLPHDVPSWVSDDAVFFITICCRPRGANQLCVEPTASRIWQAADYRVELGQWWIDLFLLMPDHLHALVSVSPQHVLQDVVTDWKRYVARHYQIVWQRDFFDHRLRGNEAIDEKAAYVRHNPVRAGLVDDAASWPFTWPRPEPLA